jgi:hypothetical protein
MGMYEYRPDPLNQWRVLKYLAWLTAGPYAGAYLADIVHDGINVWSWSFAPGQLPVPVGYLSPFGMGGGHFPFGYSVESDEPL